MRLHNVAAYLDFPNYYHHVRNIGKLHYKCLDVIEEALNKIGIVKIKKAFVFQKYFNEDLISSLINNNWQIIKSSIEKDIDCLLVTHLLKDLWYRKNLFDLIKKQKISTICIISGDKDFVHPESILKEQKYKIMRIIPNGMVSYEVRENSDINIKLPSYCRKCFGTGIYQEKWKCWTCGGTGIYPNC